MSSNRGLAAVAMVVVAPFVMAPGDTGCDVCEERVVIYADDLVDLVLPDDAIVDFRRSVVTVGRNSSLASTLRLVLTASHSNEVSVFSLPDGIEVGESVLELDQTWSDRWLEEAWETGALDAGISRKLR